MLDSIVKAVTSLDERKVIKLVKYAAKEGHTTAEIIESIQLGLNQVGKNYEAGQYGVTDLMMAGIIFEEVLKLACLNITSDNPDHGIGKILLCTIESDLHDIGKAIFKSAALMNGFEVIDLGIDVTPATILEKTIELKPNIIAISSIMTNGLKYIKGTHEMLVEANLRNQVKIIIGGLSTHNESVQEVGADAFTKDVYEGIKLCKKWVED
ncbi:MAG: dimethylamine corrinoid protein [Eubacteriaceae bacterium]|jgi:methylmalonyl-CoA mutase cobalamin-binding domain/chain|nr:dimethylamine corrinoid protein [Eubacteriaceae bacterium]MDK2904866.1 dimethylamine corrinoid protein [Eubacteriaceae bacterium]MDK2937351.1 dimethylamine corrinoid protein [Eubacteriaceae bacterium]MDK2962000.1 dimethylamine corrinoid protein [Eubacteriaceae bacterium]MDN5307730.1 dimethylamine corrinoid protein [Eubacteriaceae bacterium]